MRGAPSEVAPIEVTHQGGASDDDYSHRIDPTHTSHSAYGSTPPGAQ